MSDAITRRRALARAAAMGMGGSGLLCPGPAMPQPAERQAPRELAARWSYPVRDGMPQSVRVDRRDPRQLYLCLKDGGLAALHMTQRGEAPQETARLGAASLGRLHVMDVQQQGGLLYAALGDLFAAFGSAAGLAVIDCNEPSRLRLVGLWTSTQRMQGAAAVVVRGDRAYVGAMSHGVLVIDVDRPGQPRLVSTIAPDPHFPRRNPGRTARPNSRGLAISGDMLYIANDAGGIHVYDIGRGDVPHEVGRYVNERMAGRQQAYNNLVVEGDVVYAAVDYAGLEIVSASDPSRLRGIGWWNPWNADATSNRWFNSGGHTNQLALDAGRRLVYLSAGDSELQVVSVADPVQPRLVARHGAPGNGRGTWGLALGDEAVYLTYLRTWVPFRGRWSGLVSVERHSASS